MNTKLENNEKVARTHGGWLVAALLLSLLGPEQSALAKEDTTGLIYQPGQSYPSLPDLPGADISGEPGIMIYLSQGRAVVELDDGFYEVGDRPLEIGIDGFTRVTVLFELPTDPDAVILLTEDGQWTETIEAHTGLFDWVLSSTEPSVGLEIAVPGQGAPTLPDIIIEPIENDPDPA